jgi:division protein CdvB (Snf7/Vps24/ESCRT-III family)
MERQIVSYLKKYGNTREIDLISYGSQNFVRPPEKMKKIIDRMAVEGKIHRIVHNKLQPPEVYIGLEESLPVYPMMENQIADDEARRILEEAASVAERTTVDGRP